MTANWLINSLKVKKIKFKKKTENDKENDFIYSSDTWKCRTALSPTWTLYAGAKNNLLKCSMWSLTDALIENVGNASTVPTKTSAFVSLSQV